MAVWPVTLPQSASWQGYARRIVDSRVRTQMDAGPPKMRPRYRAAIVEHDVPVMYLTKAQWVLLETFYSSTLLNGTMPFDWTDPVSGAAVSFRFKTPPQLGGMLGPDTIPVTLNLEVMP